MVRRTLFVLALALAQATLTIGLTVYVFSSNMSRWDSGASEPTSVQVASALLAILAAPVLPLLNLLPKAIAPQGFPWEHLLFLVNGVVWAVAGLGLWRFWRPRKSVPVE